MACAERSNDFHIFVQSQSGFIEAKFSDCILKLLQLDMEGEISFTFEKNSLYLRLCTGSSVLLKHSSICPFMTNDAAYPSNSKANMKISLAAAVLLQSSDDLVLLNKRPLHMRTFPGMWVVPGGHIESGEGLHEAIIRELYEETGLHIDTKYDKLSVIAMWESAFPPFGQQPIRHHLIIYFHCQMMKDHNELQSNIKLEADEVSISLWLNLLQLKALTSNDYKKLMQISPTISVLEVSKTTRQIITEKKIEELFSFGTSYEGRIPAGTAFALQQLVKIMEEKKPKEHSRL